MRHNLTSSVKTVRVMNAVAAGTTVQNSTGVDMTGYEAVRFVALLGALTATQVTNLGIQESDDNATWGATIAATQTANAADADGNKLLITDLFRPTKRYVRAVVSRGTANAVIDGVLAELYRAANAAVSADATVSAQKIASTV